MVNGDLERKGCELLLDDLTKNQNFNIKLLLTDRHKGIRFYIRTQHPEIQHEFYVWHLSKSLMKKMKTLEKNMKMHIYGKVVIIIFGGLHKTAKVTVNYKLKNSRC